MKYFVIPAIILGSSAVLNLVLRERADGPDCIISFFCLLVGGWFMYLALK